VTLPFFKQVPYRQKAYLYTRPGPCEPEALLISGSLRFQVNRFKALGPQPDSVRDALALPERPVVSIPHLAVMEKDVLGAGADEAKTTFFN
jgi:hypothetical protein